jgi:hypothetical protein
MAEQDFAGPTFQLADQIDFDELDKVGGFQAFAARNRRPLVIKGAVKAWPAWEKWNFDALASLAEAKQLETKFQDGLIEQGSTKEPPRLPVAPYFRELAKASQEVDKAVVDQRGLCNKQRYDTLQKGEEFHLGWSHMQTFEANKLYLGEWHMLQQMPELREDFKIAEIWPGCRFIWEVVFIGPADTHTGLHFDVEDNWFFQVRGTKEFLLFDPDQGEYMSRSTRYDFGAVLSDINLMNIPNEPSERLGNFGKAKGYYIRVEAGDAVFIPKYFWHTVVSLEPSISLAVFGMTPCELVAASVPYSTRAVLHSLGLYARGNCTCHPTTVLKDNSKQKIDE